jgi:hypothetical protein
VASPRRPTKPPPGARTRLRTQLGVCALETPATEERAARDAARALIREVRFTPHRAPGEYDLEIVGDLARILHLGNKKAPSAEGAFRSHSQGGLGAGTGFEPVTFRL